MPLNWFRGPPDTSRIVMVTGTLHLALGGVPRPSRSTWASITAPGVSVGVAVGVSSGDAGEAGSAWRATACSLRGTCENEAPAAGRDSPQSPAPSMTTKRASSRRALVGW